MKLRKINRSGQLLDIAKNRNCLSKGNELDYSKAATLLIMFRSGMLGNITLERPTENGNGRKEDGKH